MTHIHGPFPFQPRRLKTVSLAIFLKLLTHSGILCFAILDLDESYSSVFLPIAQNYFQLN